MPKRLLKRTAPKVEAPKPLPARNEEPATYEEKGATNVATKSDGKMGKCVKCDIRYAHSEVDHLCYPCHKAANGYVFDEEKKRFIKEKKNGTSKK